MITVVLPCRDQKHEYLVESLRSVTAQSSDAWTLFFVVHRDTPQEIVAIARREIPEQRLTVCVNEGDNLASGINTAMRRCRTPFAALLFSDDRLLPEAVAVLDAAARQSPPVDFLHSSRRFIDRDGKVRTPVLRSVAAFDRNYFVQHGSPVKHLMCWRVAKALDIGGVDESLARHGGDDFDFPWCMLEAGARFQAVADCLYEHRVHREFRRLTTDVPLDEQVATLQRLFRKHAVPEPEIDAYLARALQGYLPRDRDASLEEFADFVGAEE